MTIAELMPEHHTHTRFFGAPYSRHRDPDGTGTLTARCACGAAVTATVNPETGLPITWRPVTAPAATEPAPAA